MTSGELAWYLDSSALVKLVLAEIETPALRAHLLTVEATVTSQLARVEVPRACRRTDPASGPRSRLTLDSVTTVVDVDDQIVAEAAGLEPSILRSLDAIHLATARQFGTTLGGMITYDERLADAASANGIEVVCPGR